MNRNKAKRWTYENSLTLAEAQDLVDKLPDSGMSKVNKSLTRKQVIDIFKGGIAELIESKGPDFNLCDNSIGNELFARNVVRECL